MESALLAGCFLTACCLVVVAARRFRRGVPYALAGALTIGALLALAPRPSLGPLPEETNDRPVAFARDGFVTSDTCRSCHPDEHASWRASYHRTMTTLPTDETTTADFSDTVVEALGKQFHLFRRGEEFWVRMDESAPPAPGMPAEPSLVEKRICMVTGSHHLQIFWYPSERTRQLTMVPVAWLSEARRWAPESATFLRPPHLPSHYQAGDWNTICMQCHTTDARPQIVNSFEMYSAASEFGISCEACHGKGEAHVRLHRNPGARYRHHLGGAEDSSIVMPPKLDPLRNAQVCGRCHGVFRRRNEAYDEWVSKGTSFQPGDDMSEYRRFVHPSDKAFYDGIKAREPDYIAQRFWSDGMIRVAGREYNGLVESPCFKHDDVDRAMTCGSCHKLHRRSDDPRSLKEWANDQLDAGMRGNQACLQCHADYGKDLSAHTHHAPQSSGSLCYNCHMPHTTYGLLKAIRSHQVDSPSVQTSVATGRPNACNQCHLDRTLAWTARHLKDWHGIPVPELSEDQRTIAATILWATEGDAAQRALMAWSFGWKDAVAASGSSWLPPYLSLLMNDPYAVVRFIAHRSLSRIPGYKGFEFDYAGPDSDRAAALKTVQEAWLRSGMPEETRERSELLLREGRLNRDALGRLLERRNHREVRLSE